MPADELASAGRQDAVYLLIDGAGFHSHGCNQDTCEYRDACHRPEQYAPNLQHQAMRVKTEVPAASLTSIALCSHSKSALDEQYMSLHVLSKRNKSVRTSIP